MTPTICACSPQRQSVLLYWVRLLSASSGGYWAQFSKNSTGAFDSSMPVPSVSSREPQSASHALQALCTPAISADQTQTDRILCRAPRRKKVAILAFAGAAVQARSLPAVARPITFHTSEQSNNLIVLAAKLLDFCALLHCIVAVGRVSCPVTSKRIKSAVLAQADWEFCHNSSSISHAGLRHMPLLLAMFGVGSHHASGSLLQ